MTYLPKLKITAYPATILLMLLAIQQVACKDDAIRKAARASDDMAVAVSLAIDTKRQLGQTGGKLISDQEELALTLGLQKVNTAVRAFHNQVKATQKLDLNSRAQLAQLSKLIIEAVKGLDQDILGIKNADARAKISVVLSSITAAISAIQLAIGGA